MECPECNAEVSGKFCSRCGAKRPVRSQQTPPAYCPSCGTNVKRGAIFCSKCATRLSKGTESLASQCNPKCPHCNAELNLGAKFCKSCGEPLEAANPVSERPPAAPDVGAPLNDGDGAAVAGKLAQEERPSPPSDPNARTYAATSMFATIGKSESRTSWILIGLVAATAIIIGLAVVVRHKNAVSDQRSQPNTISTQPSDGSATTPSSSKILTKDPEFLRLLHPLQGDDLLETSTEYTTKKQEIESKLASIQDPELRQRLSDEEWEQVDKSAYIKNEEGHLRASFPSAMQACLQKHRTDWFEVGHVEYLSTGMLRISSVEASPLELPDGATVSIDVATMNAVYSKFRVVAKDQIKQNLDVWVYEQSCSSRLTNACINLGGTPEECADPTKLREIEDSLGQGGLFADCKANPSLEEGREIVENKMRSERLVLVGQGDPIDHRMDKLLLVDYDTENVLLEISASALNGTINWKFPLGENPRGTVLPVQAQIEPSLTATQIQAVALAIIADEINYCSYTKDPKVLSYMRPRQPLTPCHEEFRRAINYKPVILSLSDHPKPATDYHLKTGQRE